MADGPGGREVGRISVRVLPDTSKFGVSLEKYLKRMEARLRLDIPVSLDQAGVAASEQELDILTRDRKVNVKTDVDTSQLGALTTAVGKVTSGGGGGRGGLFGALTSLPAIITAVATLGPVIAGALVALPGIIAAIAAPIGVIALGFQGIKDAAAVAGPAFQALKDALSGTFATALTPVFQTLATLLPLITPSMQALASAMSGVFAQVIAELAKPENVAMIQQLFLGLASAFTQLTPLIGPLVSLLLSMSRDFIQALIAQGPAFIAAMSFIMGIFTRMATDGTIQRAIEFMLLFLTGALTMVGLVVAGFTWLASATMSRFNAIAGFIQGVIVKVGQFRDAVGRKVGEVVAFIQGLPGRIMGYVANFGTLLVTAGAALIQGLINGILSMLGPLGTAIGKVAQIIGDHFPGSPVKTGPLTKWNNGGAGQRLGAMLASGLTASASTVSRASLGLANAVNVPGGELAVAGARAGGGAAISVGTVVAHDYNDFTSQMDRKRRQSALRSHG